MAFVKHYEDETQRPTREPACIHLRSKSIYVKGDIRSAEAPDEVGSSACWCNLTQRVQGPDHHDVDRCQCIPGRECYCETYEV